LYDIQFDQAKFNKKASKGRKKKDDKNKENIAINQTYIGGLLNSQHQQLLSQINSYLAMRKSIMDLNVITQQHFIQQQQQQFYPIFEKSILLAKPQVVKKTREPNRSKKNSSALNHQN
jgi:hypothetical protein